MLPLEVATEVNQNDRLRSSQLYPGAVARTVWTVMQSPDTRNGTLTNTLLSCETINHNYFLVAIQDLMLTGKLQMHHTKVVIFVGGAPTSLAETKLYKSIKVLYL